MRHTVKGQKGFTIVELTVVLVAGLMILAAGVVIAKNGYEWLKAWKISDQVTTIQKAATARYSDTGIYTSISTANLAEYLPTTWTWTNVYGGAVTVAAGTVNYQYKITEANVPEAVGSRLADKYPNNSVYDKSTMIITFTME